MKRVFLNPSFLIFLLQRGKRRPGSSGLVVCVAILGHTSEILWKVPRECQTGGGRGGMQKLEAGNRNGQPHIAENTYSVDEGVE